MSHFSNYSLLFLLVLIIASSCQKDDIKVQDEVPPITQEGLNTFGCKIDGEVLVPKDGDPNFFVGESLGLKAGTMKGGSVNGNRVRYFYIHTVNAQDAGGDYVFLYIPNLKTAGEYELGNSTGSTMFENNSPNHSIVLKNDMNGNGIKYLSFENGGEINISRYDSINSIVSGTFSFKAIKESDPFSDTLSVTEGRFDINWSTLNEEE